MKPFCFVLMPFGKKPDEVGRLIDFDLIYEQLIKPAIDKTGLAPIRADEELFGGIIHKPMFERLMLCEYAVADLSTANANVLYELGIRHGIRPHSTVLVYGKGLRLPFDVAPLRVLPYSMDSFGVPSSIEEDSAALERRLEECRDPRPDSPLFQLITDWPAPDISRLKTDAFRDLVAYSAEYKRRLRTAREDGTEALHRIESELAVRDADPAVVVDLYLSYRAVEDWQAMIDLVPKMSPLLARAVLVQEQLGFALNRIGRRDEAEHVLRAVLEEHGFSSETNGLLGRVYKDKWEDSRAAHEEIRANGYLRQAIETYLIGFQFDIRDAYPGINAATLMEFESPVDPRQAEILPVIDYAVQQRLRYKQPDYWDYATLLELSVLRSDGARAMRLVGDAVARIREGWEPKTTARNLRLIREARKQRSLEVDWISDLERALVQGRSN